LAFAQAKAVGEGPGGARHGGRIVVREHVADHRNRGCAGLDERGRVRGGDATDRNHRHAQFARARQQP
jgi:hypothetical protein